MREACGDPKLAPVLLREFGGNPLAEGRRRSPDVHGHVENGTSNDPDQLPLRMRRQLEVQPAEHTLGGPGVIVLHEANIASGRLRERGLVEALVEPTSAIGEYARMKEDYFG